MATKGVLNYEQIKICKPIFNLLACDHRDVLRAEQVFVSVDQGSSPVYADTSFLYNSYIYFGNSTSLSTKVGWRYLRGIL